MFNSPRPTKGDAKPTYGTRAKVAGTVAATCLAGLLVPIAAAAPAEASTTKYRCTLTSHTPQNATVDPIAKIARLVVSVKCAENTRLKVVMQAMEEDGPPVWLDDQFGGVKDSGYMNLRANQTYWFYHRVLVPDWDDDHVADVYSFARFRVTAHGEELAWSALDRSVTKRIKMR